VEGRDGKTATPSDSPLLLMPDHRSGYHSSRKDRLDAVTHLLAGACIARAGLNRTTVLATPTLILAAEAPDLDVLTKLKGPVYAFLHDRCCTHSIVGVALVSVAVTSSVYLGWRFVGRRGKDLAASWSVLFGLSFLGGLSHILFDFTDNYGVSPFWPFSDRWYSWDITCITDPLVTLLLFGGLLLSLFVGLMAEEFNSAIKTPRGRLAATTALISVVAICGVRDHEHRRAVHVLEARQYDGGVPVRVSAFSHWWNPFVWTGVVETERSINAVQVDSWNGDLDPQVQSRIRYKSEETAATIAAKNSPLGRAFMNWAHFPITETEPLELGERGYVVRFKDMGFELTPSREQYSPFALVRLNRDFSVADMSFGDLPD
jgi:inner membrane protein